MSKNPSLMVAYSIKRKGKKMAKGGAVSAADEKRPMPDSKADDAKMVSRNSGDKAPKDDSMTSQPERKQSMKGGVFALKEPKIMQGSTFKARSRDKMDDMERADERHMMSDMPPASPKMQPKREEDEEGPDRQGPKVPDMHATHRKAYAKGGEVQKGDYAAKSNKYEDDLLDIPPSEDEGDMYAEDHDEEDADKQGPDGPELHMKMMAEGGPTDYDKETKDMEDEIDHDEDPSVEQEDVSPDLAMAEGGEVENEAHASLASAIMAKRRMAEGGMVDLDINAEEQPNNEDDMSFNALKKENYSEQNALDEATDPMDSNMDEPKHDPVDVHARGLVDAIRAKMKKKSPISK